MGVHVRWFQKLRVKSILVAMAVAGIAIAAFIVALSATLQTYWMNQRITEIRRYASFVASDVILDGKADPSVLLSYADEVDNFTRLNVGERMIILNDSARVIQDSSKTKVGKYLINDEVLRALSGQNVVERDGAYVRIAVPVTDQDGETVQGAVYVFSTMDKLMDSINSVQMTIILWTSVIALILFILYVGWIMNVTKPIQQIVVWLGRMANGHLDVKPQQEYNNEYQQIVESVQDVTRELIEMDASRKAFVSNVSHELKTPLSSIKVLTESLLLQDSVPEEIYKEFLQDINGEIDRQNSIITDLLTLVRLDESEKSMNVNKHSLNDMAEDILKRLRPLAAKKNVELVLDNVREVMLECDEMKLTMALSNIIENGIKYNVEEGRVIVRIDSDFRNAKITVSDTGIGIEEEHYSKLFDRFYRVDKARDRGAGGTGLGLSIVKQIILLHHGTISVESTTGEGTSFYVTIPLQYVGAKEELTNE